MTFYPIVLYYEEEGKEKRPSSHIVEIYNYIEFYCIEFINTSFSLWHSWCNCVVWPSICFTVSPSVRTSASLRTQHTSTWNWDAKQRCWRTRLTRWAWRSEPQPDRLRSVGALWKYEEKKKKRTLFKIFSPCLFEFIVRILKWATPLSDQYVLCIFRYWLTWYNRRNWLFLHF